MGERFFRGGGAAGEVLANLDWRGRAAGPPGAWPQSLRTAVGLCLASRYPICIIWGPEHLYLYNDAYAPIVGDKHPAALGARYPEVWLVKPYEVSRLDALIRRLAGRGPPVGGAGLGGAAATAS